MQFRSSTFMPVGKDGPQDAVWFEAHESTEGKMIVVRLNGSPRSVGRPGRIAQYFSKPAPGMAKSVPAKATVVKTVDTPLQALEEIFDLEHAQLGAHSKFIDIGDLSASSFGGVPHYASVENFSRVAFPDPIRKAANEFTSDLSFRYLMGIVPRHMLEGARQALKHYNEPARRAVPAAA